MNTLDQNPAEKKSILIVVIIIIAALLRFYNYFDLPYFHDELSAISRVNYQSFEALINEGVLPDYHPAGVQAFLYYWTKLVGTDAWIVKLPFVLCNLASIYLAYRLIQRWSNESIALLTATLMASTQFTIIYGIYARPYSIGLFSILLLLQALTSIIEDDKINWKSWFVFILAGILCSYTQYISMMIAGIIGLTAIPFVPKKRLKQYILAGITIGLAYIPHIDIFRYQMAKGGVGGEDGWLSKPTSKFALDFLQYLFHHSYLPIITIVIIIISSIILGSKEDHWKQNWKQISLPFLLWFVFPAIVCYYYSIYKNPILQYSALYFTHFLLFAFLFVFVRKMQPKWNSIAVILILSVNIYTLISERQHYKIHYNVGFEKIISNLDEIRKSNPTIPAVISSDFRFTEYYAQKLGKAIHYHKLDMEDQQKLIHYLDSIYPTNNELYFCMAYYDDPTFLPIVKIYYPTVIKEWVSQDNSIYYLSKTSSTTTDKTIAIFNRTTAADWENSANMLDTLVEWGPKKVLPLEKCIAFDYELVDIQVDVDSGYIGKDFLIVAELTREDSIYKWTSSSSAVQFTKWNTSTVVHTISFDQLDITQGGFQLNVYVWNRDLKPLYIKEISVSKRIGNPLKYAGFNKILNREIISKKTNPLHQ